MGLGMSELPKGWIECKLSDICDIEYGKDLSTKKISNEKNILFSVRMQ